MLNWITHHIATVTGIIAPLGGVPPIVPAALALASEIAPLLLLAKMVLVRGGARFWLLLCGAQVAGCVAGLLGVLQVDSKFWTLETQLEIAHTAFVVLWAVGIMSVFVCASPYLLFFPFLRNNILARTVLPESTIACDSHSELSALSPRPSKSPSPSPVPGTDASDFLNLRDPFASPPPARPSPQLTTLTPLCPLEKPSSPFGYFGPGAIFGPRKSKRSKAEAPAAEAPAAEDVNEKRQDEPTCFPAPGELDAYEISIDAEEALLSQLLLHNLSITEPPQTSPPTSPLPNASAMYFPAPLDPLGLGRGAVVVTCERRGSSSTITHGNAGHRAGRARLWSEGSTLVDFEERRVKDLPPPPSPAAVSVHELEKDLHLVNEADETDDEDCGEEDRRATPTPPGLGGRDTPPAYFYSQHIEDEYDTQSTPRALSPS